MLNEPFHYPDPFNYNFNTYDYTPMCYYTTFEELSSGQGYCDLLCLPQTGIPNPPLVIELKWNKDTEQAIEQIKKKNYMDFLNKMNYKGDVLLVGINYNPDTKEHECKIEKSFHCKDLKNSVPT